MKLAIMQPYFFPYLGYWQLIQAVDRFVIYDDVNYIKGGWINRNRILIQGEPAYITVPVQGASPNKRICDVDISAAPHHWEEKLIWSLEQNYRRAPNFASVFPIIRRIISQRSRNLAEYLAGAIAEMACVLGVDTDIVPSSRRYGNAHLRGVDRVVDICRKECASTYVNAVGGRALYDQLRFAAEGVELQFLSMRATPYPQRCASFVAGLSIIDALMELGVEQTRARLVDYELLRT